MNKNMMRKIRTTRIRLKLEYVETVWSFYKKKHVKKLERIRRMATMLVPELAGIQYQDRLREINPSTLEHRREKGDNTNVSILE